MPKTDKFNIQPTKQEIKKINQCIDDIAEYYKNELQASLKLRLPIGMLYIWRKGYRFPEPKHGRWIESKTKGRFTEKMLCPHYWR